MDESSNPKPHSRWGPRILIVLTLAVVVPVGASILYAYSPAENTFYPGCVFNRATGLHCPGCGATRCVHALLHLDFSQALAWNPLFVVMLPFLLYGLARIGFQLWTGRRAPGINWPHWGTKAIIGLVLTFWVARNIPYEPFTLLAPHKLEDRVNQESGVRNQESGVRGQGSGDPRLTPDPDPWIRPPRFPSPRVPESSPGPRRGWSAPGTAPAVALLRQRFPSPGESGRSGRACP